MNILRVFQRLQNYLTFQLSKTSKLDGRWLFLTILIGYFVPILIASFSSNYAQKWNSDWVYPFVWKGAYPFADLRVITAGAECIRLGYNVLIQNPCDPGNRQMNYPPIWSTLAFSGLNQAQTIPLGIILGLLFFIFTFLIVERLNYFEAFIYASVLCSPSVMLAVERGNNDLIIFTLLALSVLLLKSTSLFWRCFSYLLILFSGILKIYPIFALTSSLKEKKRDFIVIFGSIFTSFIIYVIANFESLKLVSQATPRAKKLSYGGMVIFDILLQYSNKKLIMFILALFLVFLAAYLLAKSRDISPISMDRLDSFRIGSSIYLLTFLIGNNWDYRLIFLIFTMPQLLVWSKTKSQFTPVAMTALIGIILTTWLSSSILAEKFHFYYLHIDQLIDWLLLFFFIYTLILTLPKWLKSYKYPSRVEELK